MNEENNILLNLRRDFKYLSRDGEERDGFLVLHRLGYLRDATWFVEYSLDPIHPDPGKIYGTDPIDALFNSLTFISGIVKGSVDNGLKLWWLYDGDHAQLVLDKV